MTPFRFDPPLRIRGYPRPILTLDDAERYMHEQTEGRGHNREGVLRRLQAASDPEADLYAGLAFKAWLEAEGLLDR